MVMRRDGVVFVGTEEGVYRASTEGVESIPGGPQAVVAVAVADNTVYAGGADGLYQLQDNRFERLTPFPQVLVSALAAVPNSSDLAVASQEFPAVSVDGDDEQIRWEVSVDRNMTVWNKSVEEPTLDIEFSKPGYNGVGCGLLFDCTGSFRFYYSNNQDGMTAEANFPVINMTEEVPGGGDSGGDDGGSLPGGLPGFGLAAGLGSLALAAVAGSSRLNRD